MKLNWESLVGVQTGLYTVKHYSSHLGKVLLYMPIVPKVAKQFKILTHIFMSL